MIYQKENDKLHHEGMRTIMRTRPKVEARTRWRLNTREWRTEVWRILLRWDGWCDRCAVRFSN